MTDEAINRYKKNAEARENAARKRSAANFRSIVVGLLVVVAITYWFAYNDSIDWQNLDVNTIVEAVRKGVTDCFEPADRSQEEARARYAGVAMEFAKGELAYWKNAPKELRPKNAPAGTVYHALVPRAKGFDLYELKGGGVVTELSPFGKPVPMTFAEFKESSGGKPYFIACAGRVFACGGDLKTMDELRKGLLPR